MMKWLVLFSFIFLSASVQAQIANSHQPISIEAGEQLEWLREQSLYRATKDVIITQGDTVIRGDMAEARYDATIGPSELTQIDVTGSVVITQADRVIKADHALYDAIAQTVTLTGKKVVITASSATIEASDKMVYWVDERKAQAFGKARVQQPQQTLQANEITAWFTENDNQLNRAVAAGNVVITRQADEGKDVAQADQAEYNARTEKVVLTGNVRLARGDNFMQGSRATVDLKTGYSSLQNNPQKGGRVRAVFTTNGSSPIGDVAVEAPMVPAKKNPEQPYQVSR